MVILRYAKGDKQGEVLHIFKSRKEFMQYVYSIMSVMSQVEGKTKDEYFTELGFKCVGENNGKKQYVHEDGFMTCLHYLMDNTDKYYVELY